MIEHVCSQFSLKYGVMHEDIGVLRMRIAENVETRTVELPRQLRANYEKTTGWIGRECERLDLEFSSKIALDIVERLQTEGHRYTLELILREFERLMEAIRTELGKRKFAYIAAPLDKYFEQDKLFGDEVYEIFKEARRDVKDAGNALAASLPTACVFYLMRVTEHGLRKLAKKLKVKLTHKGKPCPVEFGDWDKVITAIRNNISSARGLPAGPKRQAKLESYSSAADHCEYMKDIWRNNLAHTRKPYSQPEAIAVLDRVRDFMQFLAGNLA